MTSREYHYLQRAKIRRQVRQWGRDISIKNRLYKAIYEDDNDGDLPLCNVCGGGGEASGPYRCWKCKGEGVIRPDKEFREPD